MKSMIFVILLSMVAVAGHSTANAGELYLDLGIGWLRDVPVEGKIEVNQSVVLEQTATISIDEPFGAAAVGVISDGGWFAELNRFGVLDNNRKSITRFEFGKRWTLKF